MRENIIPVLKNIKQITKEERTLYLITAKDNPELQTKKKCVKVDQIAYETHKLVEHKRRFGRKAYEVKTIMKIIPIEELKMGDIIMVKNLEDPKKVYPNRYVNGNYELEALEK